MYRQTLYKQQIKMASVLMTTGGVTVLTTTVGVTETMNSTGGGQPPWVSAVQLDKTTMEAIGPTPSERRGVQQHWRKVE